MKNFGDIKNIRRFAVHSNTESGTTRRNLSGIFCTLSIILITVSTPVWSVNAPTALRVECNGKAEPFLFSAKRTNFAVMHSTEKDCTNGITTPHKTRTPTKRDNSTKSTERLLKQLTDKVITLQRDNEEKDRKIDYLNYYIASRGLSTSFSYFEKEHPIDSQDWGKLYKMQCQLNKI